MSSETLGEASFIAYLAGSTYKVLDTLTQSVAYSGSNARAVIQSALDACKGLGKALMIKGNTNFLLDATLQVGSYTSVYGEAWQGTSQLRANGNFPAITLDSGLQNSAINKVLLRNLYVTHNSTTYPNTTGLITLFADNPGIPKAISSVRIEGCQLYDFGQNKGIGLKLVSDDAAIYKIKVDNCEFYNLNDQVYVELLQNTAQNSWINQCSFVSNNMWLSNNSALKVSSVGTSAAFDNSQWVDNNVQSGANNIGYDFETAHLGHSWFTHFANCVVWDLASGKDAWKFNGICEGSLVNCFPDYRIGGLGATNGKIVRFSKYSRTYGTFQTNGNGTLVTFNVPTGIPSTGGSLTPTLRHVAITPLHADVQPNARPAIWSSANAASFDVTFANPPPAGTNNVKFSWEAAV